MLTERMEAALNKQCNEEFFASYLYLAMVAYFEALNLEGFAHWMRMQAQEELGHAMKFFDYVNERNGRPVLYAIKEPPVEWDSPLAAFEAALGHEQRVTGLINELVDIANAESDHAAKVFLNWFLEEQVEEEASADAIVQKLRLVGDSGAGLFMLDREMAQRQPEAEEGGGAE